MISVAATMWGTTGTAATFAPPGASGLSIGAATMGIGALVLVAMAGRSVVAPLRAGHRSLVVVALGAAAIAIYPLALYSSMSLAGVAVGTVVSIGSSPVFAALLERVIDGTRLARRWMLATVVSVLGACLLVLAGIDGGSHGPGTSTGAATAVGVGLGLIAGATYAGYSFAARRLIQAGLPPAAPWGSCSG